ncbi:polyphosphate kinase 1 [bacterium]|nr:polyphosphate kinase 1 [bacterium]
MENENNVQIEEQINEIPEIDLSAPEYYINRELGLIDFQARVLAEAKSAKYPLLERVQFLGYVFHNLDEFFMVRVGGLHMQNAAGVAELSVDGFTPAEQIAQIRKRAEKLYKNAQSCWQDEIEPLLSNAGIHVLNYEEMSDKQQEAANNYFFEIIFPTLTPLAFDPGHPFPHISNLSLNLAVFIEDQNGVQHFARVKVPASLPRFIPIKRSSGSVRKDGTVPYFHYFVWIEQVIANNLQNLFPGMKILDAYPFRIIRNNDMEIQEIEAGDLLETMEESVRQRRFGAIVQLAVNDDISEVALNLLTSNLNVDRNDVYKFEGGLGLSSLMELAKVDRFDLKRKQFTPYTPTILRTDIEPVEDIFSLIRNEEILLHHPYDSFDPVVNFINAAAKDPRVLTIKQTLYRTGLKSPIVPALLRARRDYNKQVAVLVELKARFDEESNITWAKRLEEEGVHVTYGLLGLKTHSKIALVVRHDEDDVIRRYIHLGTGNYNHITAHAYEDFGYFTADTDIGADATDLFNFLTGYSAIKSFRKLLVAPIDLRNKFSDLIDKEIENHQQTQDGHMILKMNALVDKKMIAQLYRASQAGVKVDLIVRGISSIRPGIENVSENIRVVSVLGKFLEHSRVYYFYNQGNPTLLMGSADLMPRNLNNRVEVLFPIENQAMIAKIKQEVLDIYLKEDIRAWEQTSEGDYQWISEDPDNAFDVQEYFIGIADKAKKQR